MESRGVTPKAWLEAPDLSGLVNGPGPFLSLVLATEAEVDNAAHRNEVRWRDVRQELSEQGATGRRFRSASWPDGRPSRRSARCWSAARTARRTSS